MQRSIRALVCCALISSLAACIVTPPPHRVHPVQPPPPPPPPVQPQPNPHEAALARYAQIDERIDDLNHRVDNHVNQGYYPPPTGNAFHHRLDVIRQESHDMAAQHGGGLSGEEQRVLNQELDATARAIGN